MLRFLKMHIGLAKYLHKELPKKKKVIDLLIFLKMIGKSYYKELKRQLNNLFLNLDPTYRTQKKQFKNNQRIKLDLQRALKMLKYIDQKLVKGGYNRHSRRQFWRDFYSQAQVRNDVFKELEKEIS